MPGYVRNCTFFNNQAALSGGAIHIRNPGRFQISGNNFTNNSLIYKERGNGGAILYICKPWRECDVILEHNIFVENKAGSGGALRWMNKNFTSVYMNVTGRRVLYEELDSNFYVGNQALYGAD